MPQVLTKEDLQKSTHPYLEELNKNGSVFFPVEVEEEIRLYCNLNEGLTFNGVSLSQYYASEYNEYFQINQVVCHRKLDALLQEYCTDVLKDNSGDLFARIKFYVRNNPNFARINKQLHPWSIDKLAKLVTLSHTPADTILPPTIQFYKDVARSLSLATQHLLPKERLPLIVRKHHKISDKMWDVLNQQEKDRFIERATESIGKELFTKLITNEWNTLSEEEKNYCLEGMGLHELYEIVNNKQWQQTPDHEGKLDSLLIERLHISAEQLEHLKIQYTQNAIYNTITPLKNYFLEYSLETNILFGVQSNQKPELFDGSNLSRDPAENSLSPIHMHAISPFQCVKEQSSDILYKLEGRMSTHALLEPHTFTQQEITIYGGNDAYEQFLSRCYKGEKAFENFTLERVSFAEALNYSDFSYKTKMHAVENPRFPMDINPNCSLVEFLDKTYSLYSDGAWNLIVTDKEPQENKVAQFTTKHVYALIKKSDKWHLYHYDSGRKKEIDIPESIKTRIKNKNFSQVDATKNTIKLDFQAHHNHKYPNASKDYKAQRGDLIVKLQFGIAKRKKLYQSIKENNERYGNEQNQSSSFMAFKDQHLGFFANLSSLKLYNEGLISALNTLNDSINIELEGHGSQNIWKAKYIEILNGIWDLQILLAECENPENYTDGIDIYDELNSRLNTYNEKFMVAASLVNTEHQSGVDLQGFTKAAQIDQLAIIDKLKSSYVANKITLCQDVFETNEKLTEYIHKNDTIYKDYYKLLDSLYKEHKTLLNDAQSEDDKIIEFNVLQVLKNLQAKLIDAFHPQHFEGITEDKNFESIFTQQLKVFRKDLINASEECKTVYKNPLLFEALKTFIFFQQDKMLAIKENAKGIEDRAKNLVRIEASELDKFYDSDINARALHDQLMANHQSIIAELVALSSEWNDSKPEDFSQWVELKENLNQQLSNSYLLQSELLDLADPQYFENSIDKKYKEIFTKKVTAYLQQLQTLRSEFLGKFKFASVLKEEDKKTAFQERKTTVLSLLDSNIKSILDYKNPFLVETFILKMALKRNRNSNEEAFQQADSRFKEFYETIDEIRFDVTPTKQKLFIENLENASKLFDKLLKNANKRDELNTKDRVNLSKIRCAFLTLVKDYETAFMQPTKFPIDTPLEKSFLNLLKAYIAQLQQVLSLKEYQELPEILRKEVEEYVNKTIKCINNHGRELAYEFVTNAQAAILARKQEMWRRLQESPVAPQEGIIQPIANANPNANEDEVLVVPAPILPAANPIASAQTLRDFYEYAVHDLIDNEFKLVQGNYTYHELKEWGKLCEVGSILFHIKDDKSLVAYLLTAKQGEGVQLQPQFEAVHQDADSDFMKAFNSDRRNLALNSPKIPEILRNTHRKESLFPTRFPRSSLKMVESLWETSNQVIKNLQDQCNNYHNSEDLWKIYEQQERVVNFQESLADFYKSEDVNLGGFNRLYQTKLNNLRDLQIQLSSQAMIIEDQNLSECNLLIAAMLKKGVSYHREYLTSPPSLKYAVARCLGIPNATDPGSWWSLGNLFSFSFNRRKQEYDAIKDLSMDQILIKWQTHGVHGPIQKQLRTALTELINGEIDELEFGDQRLWQMTRTLAKEKGSQGFFWNPLNWFGRRKQNQYLYSQLIELNREFGQSWDAVVKNQTAYLEKLEVEIEELNAQVKQIAEQKLRADQQLSWGKHVDTEFDSIFGKNADTVPIRRLKAEVLVMDTKKLQPRVEQQQPSRELPKGVTLLECKIKM